MPSGRLQRHELRPAGVRREPLALVHDRDEREHVGVGVGRRDRRASGARAHRPRRRPAAVAMHRGDQGRVRERLCRRPGCVGEWQRCPAGSTRDRRPAVGQGDHAGDDARPGRGGRRPWRRPADRGSVQERRHRDERPAMEPSPATTSCGWCVPSGREPVREQERRAPKPSGSSTTPAGRSSTATRFSWPRTTTVAAVADGHRPRGRVLRGRCVPLLPGGVR